MQFIQMVYINSLHTSQRTHRAFIIKAVELTLFKQIWLLPPPYPDCKQEILKRSSGWLLRFEPLCYENLTKVALNLFLNSTHLRPCVHNYADVCTVNRFTQKSKLQMHYHVESPPPVCLLLFA